MSDDEGTNAAAQDVRTEDDPDDEAASVTSPESADTDGSEPGETTSKAQPNEYEADRDGSEETSEGDTDEEGSETESTGVLTAKADGPETAAEVESLIDDIAAHDEELAMKVRSIVQTARAVTETADHQRAELTDLQERTDAQAETIDDLQAKLDEREDRIEELETAVKRKQADFQNYKKRAKKRQEQLESRATEDLVGRLVGVRDNLKRALTEESEDTESLREGVEMTLREFDRVLADENVEEIDPEPGTATDPQRHEVMVKVDSAQPEGTIAEVFTPGYEMGEKVIQHAQVTVSNGELTEDDAGAPDESAADVDAASSDDGANETDDGDVSEPDDPGAGVDPDEFGGGVVDRDER